jgi:pimeloyl-ACP methyl ester carboxylesterase
MQTQPVQDPASFAERDAALDDVRIHFRIGGAGASSRPDGGYDKKTMARDIHALLRSLGVEKATIVGHDIGMMVAYAFAAQYPDEAERVVLMDAFLPGIGNWKAMWLMRDLWHFHFYGEVPLALVAGRERIYLEHFWNDFAADAHHSVPEPDRERYAAAYAQPGAMRVIAGEKSGGPFLIEQVRLVADDVDGAVIPGSGHWLLEEAPGLVIPVLRKYVH